MTDYVYLPIPKEIRNKLRSFKGASTYAKYLTDLMTAREKK